MRAGFPPPSEAFLSRGKNACVTASTLTGSPRSAAVVSARGSSRSGPDTATPALLTRPKACRRRVPSTSSTPFATAPGSVTSKISGLYASPNSFERRSASSRFRTFQIGGTRPGSARSVPLPIPVETPVTTTAGLSCTAGVFIFYLSGRKSSVR